MRLQSVIGVITIMLLLLPAECLAASTTGAFRVDAGPFHVLMLEGKIGYVRLRTLNRRVESGIRRALSSLADAKPRGVVLDLRGNGGGSGNAVVAILECFFPQGTTLFKHSTGDYSTLVVTSQPPLFRRTQPVVVIEDERTNNEVHMLSAILQKQRGAPVVRETPTDGRSQESVYGQSGRMKQYIPVKSGGFIFTPDAQVGRTGTGNRDDSLGRAISYVREMTPWDEAKR